MNLMFISNEDRADAWRECLQGELHDLNFYNWPIDANAINPLDIDYVLAWKPPSGVIKKFTNIKAILSLGAGIDGITCDPELPTDKLIVRLVDKSLSQGMTHFIVYWTIHHHRDMDKYQVFSASKTWMQLPQADAAHRRVGILGLGELGATAGRALASLQFDVAGWSRSEKMIGGITSYFGDDGLPAFLERSEILICLLPLTEATSGIVNAKLLSQLPKNAVFINCARGGHVVDDDLLEALDQNHLSKVVLDVFNTEPLPTNHPYWEHPKVTVTPHIAALTAPHSGAGYIAENIRRIERGEMPMNLINLDEGY
jgi:glyoxylate/hydroxypyruvate reductase A